MRKNYKHILCDTVMPTRELKPLLYCEGCGRHFAMSDFVWEDNTPVSEETRFEPRTLFETKEPEEVIEEHRFFNNDIYEPE